MNLPDRTEPTRHRSRLLEAIAGSVAEKGYGDTTIADIVGAAGVSRRTFYEHFATKDECFIALYEAANRKTLAVLRDAIDPAPEWQAQLDTALRAYLASMAQNPALMRTLFIGILGLGPEGLAARRRVNDEICSFMLEVVNGGRERGEPFTRPMALGVVGGINELMLQAIEQERVGHLQELAAPAGQLVRAVTKDTARK